jgi:alkylation response protein AidB-like acyl-CoA dehydrogenase
MKTFEASRPGVASMAVGVGRAAVEFAAEHSRDRVQFGHPIGQNQGVAFMLADMQASVDAARLLTWRPPGWPGRTSRSAMPRAPCASWSRGRPRCAIQILGGNGYTREYPVERWHRGHEDLHHF